MPLIEGHLFFGLVARGGIEPSMKKPGTRSYAPGQHRKWDYPTARNNGELFCRTTSRQSHIGTDSDLAQRSKQ